MQFGLLRPDSSLNRSTPLMLSVNTSEENERMQFLPPRPDSSSNYVMAVSSNLVGPFCGALIMRALLFGVLAKKALVLLKFALAQLGYSNQGQIPVKGTLYADFVQQVYVRNVRTYLESQVAQNMGRCTPK